MRRLPKQIFPKGIEREYAKELLALMGRLEEVLKPLREALPSILEAARIARSDEFQMRRDQRLVKNAARTPEARTAVAYAQARLDAGGGKRARDLIELARKNLANSLTNDKLENLAEKFARRTSTYQRVQLGRQLRAAIGVDPLLYDQKLTTLVEGFVAENVALIKDLPEQSLKEIEGAVLRGVTSGAMHKDIARDIELRLGVGRNRARRIARDQVGKFYGRVNATRQKSIGIRKFIWRDSGDERVRPLHEDRNGNVYSYDDPPSGELPGEPINCRCYAEPVIDDDLLGI